MCNYFMADAETKDFIDVNDAVSDFYGYTKEEFLELKHTDITAEPEKSDESIRQTVAGEISSIPIRYHKHKDGTMLPVEISTGAFKLGNRQMVCGVVRDITERKQAEEELRESEQNYRQIFNSMTDGLAIADFEGKFVDVNPAFCMMYGYDHDELIGLPVTHLIHPDYHHVFGASKKQVRETGKFIGETVDIRKDGSTMNVEARGGLIRLKGKEYLLGIIRDISEQKQLQAQLQQVHKIEAIGTLTGGIAHEFNNMLGIILGNTEMAIEDVPEWNPARLNLEEIKTFALGVGPL
jgi:two-component system cell cycle sensor histidine kinase/response regulator CckA